MLVAEAGAGPGVAGGGALVFAFLKGGIGSRRVGAVSS